MANTPISPKVKVPFVVGLFAASVLTNISFVSPDMLGFLGPWAPFVIGTVTAGLGALVGYKVNDPLRVVPEDATVSAPLPDVPVSAAPAVTFPRAAVDAAVAAAEPVAPVEVTPVFTPPTP